MTELSRERREKLALAVSAMASGDGLMVDYDDIRALLRDSERLAELEALDVQGEHPEARDARLFTKADEDRIVARTLREWVAVAQGFDAGLYDVATLEEALCERADALEGKS